MAASLGYVLSQLQRCTASCLAYLSDALFDDANAHSRFVNSELADPPEHMAKGSLAHVEYFADLGLSITCAKHLHRLAKSRGEWLEESVPLFLGGKPLFGGWPTIDQLLIFGLDSLIERNAAPDVPLLRIVIATLRFQDDVSSHSCKITDEFHLRVERLLADALGEKILPDFL